MPSMWNAATTEVDLFGLSQSRRILEDRIRSYFDIPSTGVVFVFEKKDYRCYWNRTWRKMAIHLNVKEGSLEEMSPGHLLRLMKSRQYSNLIWLSRQACEAPEIDFAWILTHELRHLEQDLSSHALSKAGHFLSCVLGVTHMEEPKVQNTIPTELDANLRALTVTREVFGTDAVESYVQNESSMSENQKQDFDVLGSHDTGEKYDVFGHTAALLRKYQFQFKEVQKRSEETSIATFDIERVCSELNAGPHSS